MAETINVLKQGNIDHTQKTCYHCNRQGHIKANCLARKKLYVKPWYHVRKELQHVGDSEWGEAGENPSPRGQTPTERDSLGVHKLFSRRRRIFSEGRPERNFEVGHTECIRSRPRG